MSLPHSQESRALATIRRRPEPALGGSVLLQRLCLAMWWISMGVVSAGSLLPASSLQRIHLVDFHLNDKLVHFCNYFALAALPLAGSHDTRSGIRRALTMVPLGGALEVLQRLSPGRSAEWNDFLANCAGVAFSVLVSVPLRTWCARPKFHVSEP
jgi:VanZ family protein